MYTKLKMRRRERERDKENEGKRGQERKGEEVESVREREMRKIDKVVYFLVIVQRNRFNDFEQH